MALHDDFSSKLKRVFIQLHNYSYYHGPSDDRQPDSRFIGRKRQLEKLRSVLTDTERDSGTYLITGYRGMGKTSFVNKVIESIYKPLMLSSRLAYFIFMHLLLFTLCAFILTELKGHQMSYPSGFYFLIILLFAAAAYVIKKYKTRFLLKKVNSRKHLQWSEWLLLIILNFSIVCYLFLISKAPFDYYLIRKTYFVSLLLLLVFVALVRISLQLYKRPKNELRGVFIEFGEKVRQFINYSDRIYIKLNLGYSNLQEIDILRLIARNIQISYKKYRRTHTFNWYIRVFLICGIYMFGRISWGLYSKNNIYYSFLQNTGISTVLPSQQRLYLEKDSTLKQVFNTLQKNNKTTIIDYLSYTHFLNFRYAVDVKLDTLKNAIKQNELNEYIDTSISKQFSDQELNVKQHRDKVVSFQDISSAKQKYLVLTCYADYALFIGYSYFIDFTYLKKTRILPGNLHYLFFVYIFLLLWLFRLCSRIAFHNKTSRIQVNKKIIFLNELIDSNVSKDTSLEYGFLKSGQRFTRKKTLNYQRADVREIEKRLIEIIDDIGELPVYSFRAKFTVVFDELDKIENYISAQDRKEGQKNTETSMTPESIRKRLQTVMELLSNLKYFLSTAQAKFIFIAGRELYDASLADVSDRNFRLGSIFHDVIYLNSFFTDFDVFGMEDITSRTEQYVCSFLFPLYYPNHLTLKEYNKYLLENFPDLNEEKQEYAYQKIIAKQKREKIIYLLKQFIVYLNHISAGAPSKVTAYFENYICTTKSIHNFNKNSCLLAGEESGTHYLFFDFYHQYKIGVFDYLLTPFNFSINKVIKNYGDKLIISASFLHDHLLKFHRNAFSWRDLEATPEMIDVNKNPELRDFLGIVMDFMLKTHIQEILNGLYDFKFPKKVSQEINYLSHVSEEASAVFNFTLDESLAIKQHFLNRLNNLEGEEGETEEKKGHYPYAKSSIFLTIGDLCFYDEDLGDAMVNYLEAISSIRNLDVDKLSITQVALLTRNMLKLAHTMEKRRIYDMAFLTYNEIWNKISILIKRWKGIWSNEIELTDAVDNIKYFYQPLLAKLHLTEKTSLDGIKDQDLFLLESEFDKLFKIIRTKDKYNVFVEFWNKAGDILYYKNFSKCHNRCTDINKHCKHTDNIIGKIGCYACRYYFDGLEKLIQNVSIKNDRGSNIYRRLGEFLSQDKTINQHQSKVLAMTFSDLGDVFLGCHNEESHVAGGNFLFEDLLKDDETDFYGSVKSLFYKNELIANGLDLMLIFYHLSARFYMKSGDDKNVAFQYTKILYFIKEYVKQSEIQKNENEIIRISNYVDRITSLAIASIYKAYDYIHAVEINRFKNILNSDDDFLIHKEVSLDRTSINAEIDEIVILYSKIKLRLKKDPDGLNFPLTCYGINNSMYNRFLKLKLKAEINKKYFENIIDHSKAWDIFENLFQNPCNPVLKQKIIDIFIAKVKSTTLCRIYQEEVTAQDALEFCITDSIFCYFEMLRIISTFGTSFHLNHSTLAEIHEKLYLWTELYDYYCIMNTYNKINRIDDVQLKMEKLKSAPSLIRSFEKLSYEYIDMNTESTIVSKLQNLIEPDNMPSISAVYNCEKARQAYQSAIETHEEGKAYRDFLENMYYLNDDYNDKLYHFSVALERYKLNNNKTRQRIKKLKERMSMSSIYNPSVYIKTML